MEIIVLGLLIGGGMWLILQWWKKKFFGIRNQVNKILGKHGLTLSDLTGYGCIYVGGHPDCNWGATNVVVGAKKGKLKFFKGIELRYNHDDQLPNGTLNWATNPAYLFDIPINEHTTVQIDDTLIGDFAIFIKWFDGNYPYFAEFCIKDINAKNRAYMLSNALKKMMRENAK